MPALVEQATDADEARLQLSTGNRAGVEHRAAACRPAGHGRGADILLLGNFSKSLLHTLRVRYEPVTTIF